MRRAGEGFARTYGAGLVLVGCAASGCGGFEGVAMKLCSPLVDMAMKLLRGSFLDGLGNEHSGLSVAPRS
jgi:hypothetical protein